jgi:hypothetical protein
MSSKSTFRSDSSSELEEEELLELLEELAEDEEKLDVEGLSDDTLLLNCGGWKSQLARMKVTKIKNDAFVFIKKFPASYYNKFNILSSYFFLK